MEKETCNKILNDGWATCDFCGKRYHNENCTSKRTRSKDCFCEIDNTEEYKEWSVFTYGGLKTN